MAKTYSATAVEDAESAICWGAIFAGAFAAGAITLILGALGVGTGLSLISPWSNENPSVTTVNVLTGAYLVVTAIIASTIGGYMAGRLRTKWIEASRQEVLFRDTAHGFVAWALATVALTTILGTGALSLVGMSAKGLLQGAAQGASQTSAAPTDYFVDMLLRPAQAPAVNPVTGGGLAVVPTDSQNARREVNLILLRGLSSGNELGNADRAYLAQVVSARTGLPPEEAQKRVSDVITQAKSHLDSARKHTIVLALWVVLSLFAGAFAASAAAIEGGQLRDGRWRGLIFSPRDSVVRQ